MKREDFRPDLADMLRQTAREYRATLTREEKRQLYHEGRVVTRRWLYRNDPIWRLTKLKDNRERRLRAKRLGQGADAMSR